MKTGILFLFCTGILFCGDICSQPVYFYGLKKMCLVHSVSGNFYMEETPVTYADFKIYVRAGGQKNAYWYYESYNIDAQPVTGISWHHAVDYCNWRSRCEGLTPVYTKTDSLDEWGYPVYTADHSRNGYRLPTSFEFETAAKAGTENIFPWGNVFYDSLANYDNDRGHKTTEWWRLAPVTSQYRNSLGLFNMCGNNWHWCDDWHTPLQTKMLKGGSWGTVHTDSLSISNYSRSSPGNYNYDIGFRCVRNASHVKDAVVYPDTAVQHDFYTTLLPESFLPVSDFYGVEFKKRLSRYIRNNFPECINFKMKVDAEEIITAEIMAEKIIRVCKKYNINPLFLTAIMVSESGFGTVSFPRWYNNPMAYMWQNKLMTNGLPVYEAMPGKKNRKYKTLEEGFEAFCKGIRRDLYYKAARKNLDSFHLIYVGYRADEWMHTLSRVYRDVAGVRFEPKYPEGEAGKFIYADWEEIRKTLK